MGSTKQEQAARRKAIQDTIAENREFFEERMRHYHAEMDLGEWKPRLSTEARAALKAEAKKQAVVARIKAEAQKAGISVVLVDDPDIEAKIAATHDGTAETVTGNWRGDENGFADEQPDVIVHPDVRAALADTDDENYQSREAAPATE